MKDKKDLYVIGFPKSGNTWLARLLAEVTNSKIHVEAGKNIVNSSENSKERTGEYLIHKIHTSDEINRVLDSKKVYIIRDVRDSLVSGFFHNHRNIKEENIINSKWLQIFFNYEVSGINNRWQGALIPRMKNNIYQFLRKILFKKKRIDIGNWSDHINFWDNLDDIAVVRYEDLLTNTENELKAILEKLDINISDEKLKKTIENQSFDKKKKEFIKNGDMFNATFMRSGKKESWKKLINSKLQLKIIRKHEEVMRKYNYL